LTAASHASELIIVAVVLLTDVLTAGPHASELIIVVVVLLTDVLL
jgi:hypothetical protein